VKQPVKYEDWKEEDGLWGVQAIITDKIMSKGMPQAIDKTGEMMGKAMSKALFGIGSKVPSVKVDVSRDESLPGWDVYLYADAEFDKNPEQYCYMAWENWQSEYVKRLNWENKSLWQYLRFWFRRKFRF